MDLTVFRETLITFNMLEFWGFSVGYFILLLLIFVLTPGTKNAKFIVMFLLLLLYEIARVAYLFI